MSRHNVTIVPHTHWDREWYQPFAVFQVRLIETVDQVLDLLDRDERFTHFMLDGQAVVLDDYLEVKPEEEERIREYVRNGRLAIGPWYTLADEFLSSPEALVRNLLIGIQACSRFGEPMPVVYTPDSFGHISQLPLLAHGFGFDSLVFERGVGDEGEEIGGEFRWRTADGKSSVLAVHLLTTYSSAAGIGYQDWSSYRDFSEDRAVAHASKALYGSTERIGMEPWLDDSLDRIPGGSSAYASGSNVLFLNGSDHLPPQTDLPDVIDLLNQRMPEASFRLGRLREFIDGVLAEAGELSEFQGEFRGSRYHHLLSGVFSARLYLKQANHAAQQALERYAEPLSTLAFVAGAPYPDAVLQRAWKDLLRNHCHDSICGCSIDEVHDEMMPRFAGILASSRYLGRKAFAELGGGEWSASPGPLVEDRLAPPRQPALDGEEPERLSVFNPLPRPWRGVIEALLPIAEGFRPAVVEDGQGRSLPSEVELQETTAPGDSRVRQTLARVHWLAELQPLSVTSFRLLSTDQAGRTTPAGESGVRSNENSLENEYLSIEVTPVGLLMRDKASGQSMKVRLRLEDVGDAGDEYDFSPVAGEQPRTLELGQLAAGPAGRLGASLRQSGQMLLPARLSEDRQRREGEEALPFELTLRLEAGERFARLDVHLENRSLDHRLRLWIDTDIVTERVAVEGHFDVLERPIALPDATDWFQKPSGGNHQRRFLAVGDDRKGLALFNSGLPEYSAETGPEGASLAVTLLRSVGWLSRNDLTSRPEGAGPALPTPGAQCLGEHRLELALMPFAGAWDQAGVPAQADRFTTPPLVEATPAAATGAGVLELPEGLLLSALKKAESSDDLIIRFWNPGRARIEGSIRLAQLPLSAHLVDLAETPLRELAPEAELPLSVEPKEVVSIALRFGGEAMA